MTTLQRIFRAGSVVAAALASALVSLSAPAPAGELDAVAQQIAARLERDRAPSVLVGEILDAHGRRTELGQKIAQDLSAALERTALAENKGFRVLPRERWEWTLGEHPFLLVEIQEHRTARWVAEFAETATLIVGRIDSRRGELRLRLEMFYANHPGRRRRFDTRLAATAELDRLLARELPPPSPPEEWATVYKPGEEGVGFPSCSYCPDPKMSQEARAAKHSGRVVLRVIVTPVGRAAHIRVERAESHELTEQAVEAVRQWRFKPALGPTGRPVPTEVTIEIIFRLL